MNVRIEPSSPKGHVSAPPSKSIAHRLIICASLSKGKSVIRNIALSEDIKATLNAVSVFGARYEFAETDLVIYGMPEGLPFTKQPIDCGESGSTLRFMLPLCMFSDEITVLRGNGRLLQRPLDVYAELCRKNGIPFDNTGTEIRVGGKLRAGAFEIPGDVSSQFVSGLLFALPLLQADSTLRLLGEIESRNYISLTLDAQRSFGVENRFIDERTLYIPGNAFYRSADVKNEGDWSNGAFLLALKALGADITVDGLAQRSLQGDKLCETYFSVLKNGYTEIDLSDCPDLGPILFAFAAANQGARFTGTRRLKLKESDRVSAMAAELKKFGCEITASENRVTVPGVLKKPAQPLFGHNDHRIVMSLAVLSTLTGGVIRGAEAVKKSYPDFFEVLRKLQVKMEYEA